MTRRETLTVGSDHFQFYPISQASPRSDLPYALRVLLENLLRHQDGLNITDQDIAQVANWEATADPRWEIQFTPARVIMQDFTGVPCVVDLATMRQAVVKLGGRADQVNPLAPAELVIDHSVIADVFGRPEAFARNQELEYARNQERYQFLRWGQTAFDNFQVVPPGTGIVHQVNVEYLARVVGQQPEPDGQRLVFPDTCVGTDSHTTMVNGLGVVGWGVGGIEAEAALLGQPVPMLIPRVVGFKLSGSLRPGVTATDLVLTITELLRQHQVVGQFVEFYGPSLAQVPVATRCTIGNMSPEYGSTVAIFPIDAATIDYLRLTGRTAEQLALVEAYAKAQGLWHDPTAEPVYSSTLELDLATVRPSLAGPKRPQDRIDLAAAKTAFAEALPAYTADPDQIVTVDLAAGSATELRPGTVAVAAITSCTNTSNPEVMVAAGLVAQKAVARGLQVPPWVKTTLSPGSKVVTDYLDAAGLTEPLNQLGFNLVGYGCVTCIGNTGPLVPAVSAAADQGLPLVAVLSGNRNFEGRISPDVTMNYLASPPLVIAYALAGTMNIDLTNEPLGHDRDGQPVFLGDLWPSPAEINQVVSTAITPAMYQRRYADVFAGDDRWQALEVPAGQVFAWDEASTYIRQAPYFDNLTAQPAPLRDISGARVLLKLGDSVTTDHISPAGSIKADSPAGRYLAEHGVDPRDFNSYGSRRGNHEVMVRGTFANIRLRNQLAPGTEGGWTRDWTEADGPVRTVYEASLNYLAQGTPLVILAGREYGSGSSRDWAAKGTALLGVKVVIAESYERIHRSNLLGLGVLPLQFPVGLNADSLGLTGQEEFAISGLEALNEGVIPATVRVKATAADHRVEFDAQVRIDTPKEADYLRHGGILPYVLRHLVESTTAG
ncbi:MAG: aconitate hydratase AcnA [Propionibacteriaceae bacterium]|jgi:aconitate hydratase|nr:aconitate hydratase AcnA [Propionibacteriaceae bacterium]